MPAKRAPVELLQFEMDNAHNMFKAGLDSMLKHFAHPPLDDLPNFLGYCSTWCSLLEHHHNGEEKLIFPWLNTKLDFAKEAEEHKGIHDALDLFGGHLKAAQEDPAKFNAEALARILRDLREPLFRHLDEEVAHLAPETMRAFTDAEITTFLAGFQKEIVASASPWLDLPYARGHTAPRAREEFPPLPWFLRSVLVPYVFARKYSGYWKYSPYPM